jgi:putative transposase
MNTNRRMRRIINPALARHVDRARDWRWSGAKAHLTAREDGVTLHAPVLNRFPRFADLLNGGGREELLTALRRAETIGRPIADEAFLAGLETP